MRTWSERESCLCTRKAASTAAHASEPLTVLGGIRTPPEQKPASVWDGTRRMGIESVCPVLPHLRKQLVVLGRKGLVLKFLLKL